MMKKVSLYEICFLTFVALLFSAPIIYADVLVGVKKGDWVEYDVICNGVVPEDHNVTWAKIEVIGVDGNKVNVAITSRFLGGKEETVTSILNIETGEIGDGFIIPANLREGDTFVKQIDGTVTISEVEKRTYANEKREVVTATTSSTEFYWDQLTGFLVEASSTYENFSIGSKMEKTNLWQAETFGLHSVTVIVLLVLVIVIFLAFFLKF